MSATGPAELVVQGVGWRGLFAILAAALALVALLVLLVVPERDQATAAASSRKIGFLAIYCDPRFWRIAPLAAIGIGTSFSLQGLWAAPWLADVAGLDRSAVVEHLTLMAAVLAASALLLRALAERLRRLGLRHCRSRSAAQRSLYISLGCRDRQEFQRSALRPTPRKSSRSVYSLSPPFSP